MQALPNNIMSYITLLIIRILMKIIWYRINLETGEDQCFVQITGIRNAIFRIWMISEDTKEMQKDVYFCFINYKKGFNKVQNK